MIGKSVLGFKKLARKKTSSFFRRYIFRNLLQKFRPLGEATAERGDKGVIALASLGASGLRCDSASKRDPTPYLCQLIDLLIEFYR